MRLGMNRYLGWDDLSEPGRDLEIPLASDAVGREVDVGINYADYYLVEAMLRYLELRGTADVRVMPRRMR